MGRVRGGQGNATKSGVFSMREWFWALGLDC